MPVLRHRRLAYLSVFACLSWGTLLLAKDPLRIQIDRIVEQGEVSAFPPLSTDASFARRIYLDLVGRTPRLDELEGFCNAPEATKREALIVRLLDSAEFANYFAKVLDVMLMERRPSKRVSTEEWLAFLENAVREQRSLAEITRSILVADGRTQRGAARFLLDREVEPHALTRDIGRVFLGRDLQCAQCHDHPNIGDYLQAEYFGVFALVERSYLFEDSADSKKAYVGEKAEGRTAFQSVFDPDADPEASVPGLLGELSLDLDAAYRDGEYWVAPSGKVAGVPVFSRRRQLARLVTRGENRAFARNLANRLWAHMMGRGIVEPVDFHHEDNPPALPLLLEALSEALVAEDFSYRKVLAEIALSRTYQRSIDLAPVQLPSRKTMAAAEERLQRADEADESERATIAESRREAVDRLLERRAVVATLDERLAVIEKRLQELREQSTELTAAQAKTQQQVDTLNQQQTALAQAVKASQQVVVALPKIKSLQEIQATYAQENVRVAKALAKAKAEQKKLSSQLTLRADEEKTQERLKLELSGDRAGGADMVAEARGVVLWLDQRLARLRVKSQSREQRRNMLELGKRYLDQQAVLDAAQLQLRQKEHDVARRESALGALDAEQRKVKTALLRARQHAVSAEAARQAVTLQAQRWAQEGNDLQAAEKMLATPLRDVEESSRIDLVASVREARTDLLEKVEAQEEAIAHATVRCEAAEAEVERLAVRYRELLAAHRSQTLKQVLDQQSLPELQAHVVGSRQELDAVTTQWRALQEQRFVLRAVRPLTPEQLSGATRSALRLDARFAREANQEWSKKPEKEREVDEAQRRAGITSLIRKREQQVESTFVSLFAAPAGSPQDVFSSTADQSLFLSNDGQVQSWLRPSPGTTTAVLESFDDSQVLARELYRSVLCREPTEEEERSVQAYLDARHDQRKQAIRELTWALLASLEFRFNH